MLWQTNQYNAWYEQYKEMKTLNRIKNENPKSKIIKEKHNFVKLEKTCLFPLIMCI